MKIKLAAIVLCAMLLISVLPVTALAYDYAGSTYNDNDFVKMQTFLNKTSADGTHTNGQQLNPSYNPDNPVSWWYVYWSDGSSDKRITSIDFSGKSLAGSVDLSGFTSMTYAGLMDNSITSVNVSGDNALTHLDVRTTDIIQLDASGLTALGTLYCSDINWKSESLTSLDVSGCTALEMVGASESVIDTLNVSGCTALKTLTVSNNKLTALDVSDCAALERLDVSYNRLVSLDVSQCPVLKTLNCEVNQTLTTLTIQGASGLEEVRCPDCALTALDASGLTSLTELDCSTNSIETLDVSDDTALESLDCGINELESLSAAGLTSLNMLDCSYNSLTEIEGLSDAANLQLLGCSYNQIEELDLSEAQYLAMLICDHNELTSLDVSGDPILFAVACDSNRLTTLDLSDSTMLQFLLATDNRLKSIKAVIMAQPVNLTANGGGYVEIYAYDEYYANAVPCTGESFIDWTDAADAAVSTAVRYDLAVSTAYDLTANFTALALESDDADGAIFTGGRLTLTPNQTGGTWDFDAGYLSRDGGTFTGLKAGTTRISYSWGEETVTFDVTIRQSELPETGQDMMGVWLLCGAALILAGAGVLARRRTAVRAK